MSHLDPTALDGNAAAGAFMAVLGVDVTTALLCCATCRAEEVFASQHAYVQCPGTVLRCHGCGEVLARVAVTPRSTWLDLSGCTTWRLPPDARTEHVAGARSDRGGSSTG